MALIKCPKCGQEISDKAKKCIHCGNILLDEAVVIDKVKCSSCGNVISDDKHLVWKCTSCEKAFKVSLLKLKKMYLQKSKPEYAGKMLLKCPTCGNWMDDGNEKIAYKCPVCENVMTGNLKYFGEEKQAVSNMIICPECGKENSNNAKECFNCGYPIKVERKKLSVKVIGILTAIILMILGGALFVWGNNLDDTEKEQVNFVDVAILDIGEVSIESEAKIVEAENLYEKLSKKCQRHVKNHKELINARKTYDDYRAKETSDLIDQIGEITSESYIIIEEAQKSYESLSEDQKKLVKNYEYLMAAVEKVSELEIENTQSKISAIGTVDLESENEIRKAREAYNNLTEDAKLEIENYDVLRNAESEYEQLAVNHCIALIDSIGEVTLDSKSKIDKAKIMYDSLSKESKEKVTNYLTLKSANDEYIELAKEEDDRNKTLNPGDSFSTSKWEVIYKKTDITAKILPNSTSGYYMYYYADDNETFVDMVFQIKNVNTDILGIDGIVGKCEVEYDGSKLTKNYNLYVSNGSNIDKIFMWDGLDALDSTTLHVAISMPRELQTNGKSVTVKITIAGEEKIIKVR